MVQRLVIGSDGKFSNNFFILLSFLIFSATVIKISRHKRNVMTGQNKKIDMTVRQNNNNHGAGGPKNALNLETSRSLSPLRDMGFCRPYHHIASLCVFDFK